MKILALDASSDHCSVAVLKDGKAFSDVSETPRAHAQRMLPMVDKLLTAANITLTDIDLIALTHGPGSFTGIRIAVSIAQGLSYSSSIPCLPVSSMSAMAYEYANQSLLKSNERIAHETKKGDLIFAALDARMQEVYWSVFEVGEVGLIERQAPTLSSESNFLAHVLDSCAVALGYAEFSSEESSAVGDRISDLQKLGVSIHCIGNGWTIPGVKEDIASYPAIVRDDFQPSALGILSMLKNSATLKISDSQSSDSVQNDLTRLASVLRTAEKLEPLYLRNEVSWKKRARIRTKTSAII